MPSDKAYHKQWQRRCHAAYNILRILHAEGKHYDNPHLRLWFAIYDDHVDSLIANRKGPKVSALELLTTEKKRKK